jgi:MarR family transcriptional regulator, organic hydroperoxide resistance regulator
MARAVLTRTTKARVSRPPAIGLGMLLRAADSTFNRHLRDALAHHDVTFGQFQHLRNLWVENGLTQAELSRRIGIEMASSTAILDSLEARRLITRVRNVADRRKINVFLTPAGAALKKPLMTGAARVNKEARRGLTDAELASVFTLIGRIIANLEAMRTAAPAGEERVPTRRSARRARG